MRSTILDHESTSVQTFGPTRAFARRLALLVLFVALPAGIALAHAQLERSDPLKDATLVVAPSQVTLRFTERVETTFSIFKVYSLGPDQANSQETTADVPPLAGPEALRINALAGVLVGDVLMKRDDAKAHARVDTGLSDTASASADVTIALRPDLPAGDYVVMWRVLSEDTHTSQGYVVFRIAAGTN